MYTKKGRDEEALALYRSTLARNPESYLTYFKLGNLLLKLFICKQQLNR